RWRAGRSRWQWPSTEVACDGPAASEASGCVTSLHTPVDTAPPCAMPRASLRSVLLTCAFQHGAHTSRLNADHRQARFGENPVKPLKRSTLVFSYPQADRLITPSFGAKATLPSNRLP